MTPTPEQLAAVLPRCMAGIDGGDWTEDDERLAWATKVLRYVELAARRDEPPNTEEDIRATIDWLRSLPRRRYPHEVLHGDTWEARDGRATIVASNDWPTPAKGTHESDLAATIEYGPTIPGLRGTAPDRYFDTAMNWSRTR